MDYPYDATLDKKTLAFLGAFRAKNEESEPDDEMAELITDAMPADLKAWLHTYSHHSTLISFGDVWFEADNCMPLSHVVDNYEADELEECARVGTERLDLDSAIVMGNTADGEVFYAAAWGKGDKGLTMVKFCMGGYAEDGFKALGELIPALRAIAENVENPDDVDEAVRGIL